MNKGIAALRRLPRLAAAALCAAALCSCAPPTSDITSDPPAEIPPQTLHFQVNSKLPVGVLEQTDAFAERVKKLSGGAIQVEVTVGLPDHGTVGRGEADFAFVRNSQMSQADEVFSMFSLPFFYSDPIHMGAALNSERLLDALTQRLSALRVMPLAAFYNGASYLATDNHELRKPSDFKDLVIAMRTDNATKLEIFEALGSRVLPYTQTSVTELLGDEIEVLPADLSKPSDIVRVDTVELTLEQGLTLSADPETLYFIKTYHTISPLWVIANADRMAKLGERERAILNEAMAGLVAGLELRQSERENALLAQIAGQGIAVVDIQRTRASVASWIYGAKGTGTDRYKPPAYFDPRIYKMVQEVA